MSRATRLSTGTTPTPQARLAPGAETAIACIGLGNIGSGVAANLIRAGYRVRVCDLDPAKVDALVASGATGSADVDAAVAGADVVVTSLPGPPQIEAVAGAILDTLAAGTIWMELSTNDPDGARRLAARASNRGVGFIDAPVSGGPEGAAAGTLSIYVGGDADTVQRAMPVLSVFGARIDRLGPVGAGLMAKIAQVTLCYTQTVTLTEAWLLGVKGGVDPAKMLEVIQHSAGASYCADAYGPEILAGTFDASFPLRHALKDLRLAVSLADAVGADLPFMNRVADLYANAVDTFGPDEGHCRAAEMIEARNDVYLRQPADRSRHPDTMGD